MASSKRCEPSRSVFVGNLTQDADEDILEELFTQGGPVTIVALPLDADGKSKNFAFIEFENEISVRYVCELFNGILLFNRPLTVRPQKNEREKSPRKEYSNYSLHHSYSSPMTQNSRNHPYHRSDRHRHADLDSRWQRHRSPPPRDYRRH